VRVGDCLIDRHLNPQLIKEQSSLAAAAVAGVVAVHHTSVHVLASGVMVRCTIEVNPKIVVEDAYVIARKTRKAVEAVEHVGSADIHLELFDHNPFDAAPRTPERL
jgi:divalent metal cation (Fe/Co/Zn/Cd) transporter